MVLVPVGESAVSISINGTERVNEIISDDTTYNLSESFNSIIKVNGNNKGSFSQDSDAAYNISVSQNNSTGWNEFGSWRAYDDSNDPEPYYGTPEELTKDGIVYGAVDNYEGYYSPRHDLEYSTNGGSSWTKWFGNGGENPKFTSKTTNDSTRYFSSGTLFRLTASDNSRYDGGAQVQVATSDTWVDKSGQRHLKPTMNIGSANKV